MGLRPSFFLRFLVAHVQESRCRFSPKRVLSIPRISPSEFLALHIGAEPFGPGMQNMSACQGCLVLTVEE